jgi:hypothetical protein
MLTDPSATRATVLVDSGNATWLTAVIVKAPGLRLGGQGPGGSVRSHA